jgi:hypothetical protein
MGGLFMAAHCMPSHQDHGNTRYQGYRR